MSKGWSGGSTTRWRTLRAYVLERDGYLCRVGLPGCTEVAPLRGGHVDHIVPKDMGGTDEESNLRASCATCNLSRKKARPEPEPDPRPVSRW